MANMNTVHFAAVCVGTTFGSEYVENLYKGIARNFKEEWDFTVIVNDESIEASMRAIGFGPDHIHDLDAGTRSVHWDGRNVVKSRLPLPPSWWHKLNLFRSDIWPYGETVFYMDLDSIVVGDLTRLSQRKGFNMLNWNGPFYPYGSGVMIFPAGIKPEIWEVWSGASEITLHRKFPKGDQQLIAESFEGEINPIGNDEAASYKRDRWQEGPEKARKESRGASIVAFHGKPRPHELLPGQWGFAEWRGS